MGMCSRRVNLSHCRCRQLIAAPAHDSHCQKCGEQFCQHLDDDLNLSRETVPDKLHIHVIALAKHIRAAEHSKAYKTVCDSNLTPGTRVVKYVAWVNTCQTTSTEVTASKTIEAHFKIASITFLI